MEPELGRILNTLPGLVFTANPQGRVDFLNQEWLEFSGLDGTGPSDLDWEATINPDDFPDLRNQWKRIIASGERADIRTRLRQFDGCYRRFDIRCKPLRDAEGRVVKWYGLAIETSVEEPLSANESDDGQRRERQVLDSIPAGVGVLTRTGAIEAVNRHMLGYLGKTEHEVINWVTADIVHPDDLQRVVDAIDHAVASGEPFASEHRLLGADSQYRWFQISGCPVRNAQGSVLRWYALHIDIDERKHAEEALRRREVDLRRIINAVPTTAWSTDPHGYVDFLSDRWLDYSGFTAEQASGFGWGTVIHPDDAPSLLAYWEACLASGDPVDVEARMRRSDGEYRWFLFRANPLRDENGSIIKWYGTNIDIEDRKRAEEDLRASERRLNQIINTIPTAAWSTLPDGYCDFLHQRWLEYAGMTPDQGNGWGWNDAIHPDDLKGLILNWDNCLRSGVPVDAEARIRRFDGVYRWFLFRANPLRDESGNIVKWYGANVDIEDFKSAEEALAESERQSRLIVNTIPGLVAIFRPDGGTESVNEQFLDYLGQTRADFENWRTNGTVHPDSFQEHIDAFERSFRVGTPIDFETRLRRSDGIYRWFHVRGNPLRASDGAIVRWYCLMTDVDDRRHAEEAVRASEVNLRKIINTLPTTAWSTAPDGYVEFLSDRWLDYAGVTAEQASGFGWGDVIHPDDQRRLFEYWGGCLVSGERVDVEARMRRYDGVYRWFLFRANPLRDQHGAIVKWYGTNIDIEDRKRADEALRESERHSRLIVDTIPGMIALFAPDGELDGGNQQLLEYFDRPIAEMKHWVTTGMTHPEDVQGLVDAFRSSITTGEPYEVEARFLRFDGVYRWFQIRCLPLRDADAKIVRWYGLLTDIHARKVAEEELRRSEAFLADAQRVSRTGSFAWRIGSETVTWSDETYRIYGFDPCQPMTLDLITTRLHPDNIPTFKQVLTNAQEEWRDFDYETKLVMSDQSIKYVRVVAHNERNKDGVLELRGAVRDVTASRLAEEALSKARSDLARVARVTSLGLLTASIAHEVNQPLAGIVTNADACLRHLDRDPPNIEVAKQTAQRMIRDGNRAADVISRLRALFSQNTISTEAVDLNEAVKEVIALSRGDIQRSRTILRTDLAEKLPLVAGDRVQLQQVILNLLRNAIDAMNSVGDLPKLLQIKTGLDHKNRIFFSVSDVGVGFGEGDTERVFDAFYSTKADGMGIGLSISRSIIESHKGQLSATSNDGPGVTVSFCIPQFVPSELSAVDVADSDPNTDARTSARHL